MTQLLLAVFGLAALWMAYSPNMHLRRYSPVVGLLGQPAWMWFAIESSAWGLAVLCAAYTAVYLHGAIRLMRKPAR